MMIHSPRDFVGSHLADKSNLWRLNPRSPSCQICAQVVSVIYVQNAEARVEGVEPVTFQGASAGDQWSSVINSDQQWSFALASVHVITCDHKLS